MDAVICIEVLEHLFLPQLAASEMFRVLRPGGVLLATVPNVAYWRRRVELAVTGAWNPYGDPLSIAEPWRDPHIRFFNSGAPPRMLEKAGSTTISVGGHDGTIRRLPRPTQRILPGLLGLRLHAVATK